MAKSSPKLRPAVHVGKYCYKCHSTSYYRCNTVRIWIKQNVGSRTNWQYVKRSVCVPKCQDESASVRSMMIFQTHAQRS